MKNDVGMELTARERSESAQLHALAAILESNYRDPNEYEVLVTCEDMLNHISNLTTVLQAMMVNARDRLREKNKEVNR